VSVLDRPAHGVLRALGVKKSFFRASL
jgi:hypothetical protein